MTEERMPADGISHDTQPKYTVVSALDRFTFAEEVTAHLRQGWECQGGMIVSSSGFNQAMIFDPKKGQFAR